MAAGGTGVANWTQDYAFDRYGNKTTTTKSGVTADSAAIPLDGLASQSFDAATNRITTANHEYDNAGNQTRGKAPDGTLQKFEFDEAGRIIKIKTDAGADIEINTYATSRERIIKENAGTRTYYAWGGSSVLLEYTETSTTPGWAKSYIYAGSRLLSTITKNGAAELTEYHHPDRLGTKAVSDTTANTFKEQATLPFGAEIPAETVATSNQRFTSYDRSGATGLDYAVNRTYNSGQSRFTTVDPIGMASASIGAPQSLNLFAYTQNNPVDFIDSNGLLLEAPTQYACTTTRIWGHWEDGNGNITGYASYSSTSCQEVGGGGGGAGGNDKSNQKDDNCEFPNYDDLTDTQKGLIDNKSSVYDSLSDRQKANFLNQTSRAAQIGLDLSGLVANPMANTDRLVLTGNTSLLKTSFDAVNKAGRISDRKPVGHGGVNEWGGRQSVGRNSLQLGGGNGEAFIDIDYFNPEKGGLFRHLVGEVLRNGLTGSETNPFRVGRGIGSDITKYKCKKANP